jgi:rhamnose utilization protein RhaD (predicted bifunctional aldolase and dehydrogenase)
MTSIEMNDLRRLSAVLGADPLLVQAAGGNTSLKLGDTMWIKASGTWLKDAAAKDIFVPLDLPRLKAALVADSPDCESCVGFVRSDLNPSGLRPSIETSVHGLMPQAVVLHVHCVNTIAFAVREDGEAELARHLKAFNWAFVPYARPGLQLSQAIKKVLRDKVDVLVLGNHGLVVAAETVAAAEALLRNVIAEVTVTPHPLPLPDIQALQMRAAGTDYRLPQDITCHAVALDASHGPALCHNVYYPDHVVFLGQEIPSVAKKDAAALAFPGIGVLVRSDAKPSVEPMLRCAGDVARRLPPSAKLKALTPAEIGQLLNWDAEKYRQTIKA